VNPDDINPNHPQWWTLERDGVAYTFRETSGHSRETAGKIRIVSSTGKTDHKVYSRSNARSFWNSLIECGYVLREQGEAPQKQSYADIYEELVEAVEEVSCKIDPNYKRWKKEYDKEYSIDTYANYALEA